jgi:hypothetical protein
VAAILSHGKPRATLNHAALAETEPPAVERKRKPTEAVADIRELRKGVTLGGLKIRDLINEARK